MLMTGRELCRWLDSASRTELEDALADLSEAAVILRGDDAADARRIARAIRGEMLARDEEQAVRARAADRLHGRR